VQVKQSDIKSIIILHEFLKMAEREGFTAASHPIIVLCGPTATGKSAQALRLAEKLASPILSADSRQIYRDFNIGTAKPTGAEQARCSHYLIDIADPRETFTVAQYQVLAQELIQTIQARQQIPILVGGTGLYIQSVTAGLSIPSVPPHPQLRQQLQFYSQALRYAFLQQIDPIGAAKIHPHDAVRTLRSLEVFYVTGQPRSQLQTITPPNFSVLMLGLTCDPICLRQRIAHRTRTMLNHGWIEEVKGLQQRYGADLPLLQTLGYREIGQYLAGVISWEQMEDQIVQHTRQFAKKQMTWFRHQPGIHWFTCEDPNLQDHLDQQVHNFLRSEASDLSCFSTNVLE
jgi:tRNA dimethylallyltransferase